MTTTHKQVTHWLKPLSEGDDRTRTAFFTIKTIGALGLPSTFQNKQNFRSSTRFSELTALVAATCTADVKFSSGHDFVEKRIFSKKMTRRNPRRERNPVFMTNTPEALNSRCEIWMDRFLSHEEGKFLIEKFVQL